MLPMNDNRVGAITESYSPFKKPFKKPFLHDRIRTVSTQVFSCRFFSSRFFSSFVNCKNSTPKATVYWIRRLIFSGKAIHFSLHEKLDLLTFTHEQI